MEDVRSMEGLGGSVWREDMHDFVHARFKRRNSERSLQVWLRRGVVAHRFVVLHTAPLRIHRDLRSIEAAMKVGGQEARGMTYRVLSRPRKQVDEFLLLRRPDSEDVDQNDGLIAHGRNPSQQKGLARISSRSS